MSFEGVERNSMKFGLIASTVEQNVFCFVLH